MHYACNFNWLLNMFLTIINMNFYAEAILEFRQFYFSKVD